MTKKIKGIDYANEPQTMPSLLKMLNEELEKRKEELTAREKAEKASLDALFKEEKRLIALLKKEQDISDKMQADYLDLEKDVEAEIKKKVEKGALRAKDVKSGKISLRQFNNMGQTEKQLSDEIVKQVTEKLKETLEATRAKGLEVMKIEKEKYEVQDKISLMMLRPGVNFLQTLKGIEQYGEAQLVIFQEYLPRQDVQIKEIQQELWLTENKTLGGGHTWETMTVKEAKKIIHDPCLPADLVGKLLSLLAELKEDKQVAVSYLFKEHDLSVRVIRDMQKVVTTGPGYILTSYGKKGPKIARTSDLKEGKNEQKAKA